MHIRGLIFALIGISALAAIFGLYGPAVVLIGLAIIAISFGVVRIGSMPPQLGVRVVCGEPVAILTPGFALAAPYWPFEDSVHILDVRPRDFRFDNLTLRADAPGEAGLVGGVEISLDVSGLWQPHKSLDALMNFSAFDTAQIERELRDRLHAAIRNSGKRMTWEETEQAGPEWNQSLLPRLSSDVYGRTAQSSDDKESEHLIPSLGIAIQRLTIVDVRIEPRYRDALNELARAEIEFRNHLNRFAINEAEIDQIVRARRNSTDLDAYDRAAREVERRRSQASNVQIRLDADGFLALVKNIGQFTQ